MVSKIGVILVALTYVCTTAALPACVCTRNFKPVCGSDGKTYSNQCLLECEKFKTSSEIRMIKEGDCDEAPLPVASECICPYNYSPVCGSDGKTYPNSCSLNCEKSQNPSLEVARRGECAKEEVKVADLPCICTKERKQLCGTDGVTYSNPCLLNCAASKNTDLAVSHPGPCDDRVKVVEQPRSVGCTCTRDLKPVCGSDGVTYNNECLMKCQGKDVKVKREGPCED